MIAEHRLDFLKDLGDTYLYFENGEVTHTWSRKEWLALSEDNRHQLGLRSGENLSFASQTLPEVPAQNDLRVHELTLTAGKKSLGGYKSFSFSSWENNSYSWAKWSWKIEFCKASFWFK